MVWAGGYRSHYHPYICCKRRIIAGTHFLASSSNLFRDLKLLKLADLYSLQLAVCMYRHHNHSLPIPSNNYFISTVMVQSHNTRGRSNLYTVACRTNVRRFSVKLAGPELWNSIDINLRTFDLCLQSSI